MLSGIFSPVGTTSGIEFKYDRTAGIGTITGGVVRTSSSGQRVVLDGPNNAIRFYDAGGTLVGSIVEGGTGIELEGTDNFGFWDKGRDVVGFIVDSSGGAFDKHLRPIVHNEWSLGRAAAKMSDIWAVDTHFGDVGFENHWYLTENYKVGIKEEGIAVLNPKNKLMMFIGETGLYVPGGNIKNLDNLPYTKTSIEQRKHMDKYPELRNNSKNKKVVPIPDPKKSKKGGIEYKLEEK